MNLRQFQTRGEIEIEAPVDAVYAVAADPALVPRYVPEVERIEPLMRLPDGDELVRATIRIAGRSRAYTYRYKYRPPYSKSGVQERSPLYQSFFTLSFTPIGDRTRVVHTEGVRSWIPGLASVLGFLYFRFLAPKGTDEELGLLKDLVEKR